MLFFSRIAPVTERCVCFSLLALALVAACGDSNAPIYSGLPSPVTVDAAGASAPQDAAAPSDASATPASDGGTVSDTGAQSADANTTPVVMDAALDAAPPQDSGGATDTGAALSDAARDGSTADASTDGATVDAASDAASGDGGPALPAAQARTVKVGTADRTFLLYAPSSSDKQKPAPLAILFHGFTMSGKIMEEITTWKAIAERERIVVAFPDGGTFLGPWNVGENVCNIGQVVAGPADQDDLGFVQAIIESAQSAQPINKSSVFVGGFSMGGYFANHVGCQGRAFVRAVSAHSGGTYSGTCPGNPIPILLIHGDADGLIDYECATQARGYWIERNGCTSQVMNETIKGGSCDWNQGCPAGRELGLCTMKGMDHGWAGAPTSGPGAWLTAPLEGNLGYGGGVQYEDAAELMWKFFKRYL